jgi:hypothetical protein
MFLLLIIIRVFYLYCPFRFLSSGDKYVFLKLTFIEGLILTFCLVSQHQRTPKCRMVNAFNVSPFKKRKKEKSNIRKFALSAGQKQAPGVWKNVRMMAKTTAVPILLVFSPQKNGYF